MHAYPVDTPMRAFPFWRYYGGKFRAVPRYPKPAHGTIIEPFAGAAGYALRYPDLEVILVERYAVVAEMWRYLIGTTPEEVRRIPTVEHVNDLPGWVPEGARSLVGFAMNSATVSPRLQLSAGLKKLTAMGRRFEGWNATQRERVAAQVPIVKHWRIIEGHFLTPRILQRRGSSILPTRTVQGRITCTRTWTMPPLGHGVRLGPGRQSFRTRPRRGFRSSPSRRQGRRQRVRVEGSNVDGRLRCMNRISIH